MKTRIRSTKSILLSLKERQGLVCGICKFSLEKEWKLYENWLNKDKSIKRGQINLSIDHIVPRSKKGSSHLINLQLAHITCNNKKGNGDIVKKLRKKERKKYL